MEGTFGVIEGAFEVLGQNKIYFSPRYLIVSPHSNMSCIPKPKPIFETRCINAKSIIQ